MSVHGAIDSLREPAPAAPGARRRRAGARRLWKLAAGALLLVLAAALWRYRLGAQAAAVDYTTAAVTRGLVSAKVTANGTVSPLLMVKVGSQVSGRIASLLADYGSKVSKGQTIATIEPSFFRAAVAQARANAAAATSALERTNAELVQAERRHVRASSLFREGVGSRAELEATEAELEVARTQRVSAQATLAQARAALEQAELNLRYTTIVSPIDGVVISRDVDIGQTVAATLQAPTLFTIAQDLARMQVDTNVAEADVGKIRAGMDVTFVVDAYPGHTFRGTVRQVRDAAQTVQNVVTYDAVIDVDNPDYLLKPGMTASVTFVHATRSGVLRLPNTALRFKPDETTHRAMTGDGAPAPASLASDERAVWVLRAERPQRVEVRVGVNDGTNTEIVSGDLREGDRVIVEARATASEPGR